MMERSSYSPSVSPVSPSPSPSDSSIDDIRSIQSDAAPSISQSGSPAPQLENGHVVDVSEVDTVTCLWEDCGIVFTHLPTLIEHIHNDHIGVHKSNYTCEWATCSRRSLAQTSRFALISHIRSHTGEKPFTCPRPECDKSFTRSDALAKHMRLQHNISPPLPGRGGNRKRKREEAEPDPPPAPPVTTPASHGGFSTFKVEPHTPSELDDHISLMSPTDPKGDYFGSGNVNSNGAFNGRDASPGGSVDGGEAWDDGDDGLPAHLLQAMDPQTGLIMGRSASMVRYLVTKAKHRYALEQHEHLLEELRVARYELKREIEEKDALLDDLLRMNFGSQADVLIRPVECLSLD